MLFILVSVIIMLKFLMKYADNIIAGCPDAKGSAAELEILKTKVGYLCIILF